MNQGDIMGENDEDEYEASHIWTVADLREALLEHSDDTPVMIAVVKYPEEFRIKIVDGVPDWTDHTSVECQPLEGDGVLCEMGGILYIAVELTDYSEQRHFAGG